MNLKRVLITGGTGLVGSRLVKKFDQPIVTSRNTESAKRKFGEQVEVIEWNSYHEEPDLRPAGKIDAIVHLMGESIASGRWNEEKKKRIRESRVVGTKNLVNAISKLEITPECLVSASAIGWYGDEGGNEITETSDRGNGFLSDVCHQWEESALAVQEHGIRLAIMRVGIVLAREGGALAEMLPIFKTGLGGRLGSGKQYFPWVHIDDLVSMIHWAVLNPIEGPLNATAPNPVTNAEFTKQLAASINRPAFLSSSQVCHPNRIGRIR